MRFEELELLDFHVTDLKSHVNTASAEELALSAKSSISARTAEPFDGRLYLFMTVSISSQSDELFILELTSETVMKLPDYKKEVSEEDAPVCIELSRRETYRAIRELTAAMGITPLDLDAC